MRLYKHKWRGHYSIYLNTADGFCKLNINPDGTAELYDLVVYPESRGRRHGSLLLSLAIQVARTEKAEILLLWPDCERWTVEWYERRGFRRDPFWRNVDGEPAWALEL